MQPGYPGQDPYGQQPSDPNAPQPQDPYAQPQQPTSGQPYGQPTSGQPAYGQPTSGQPYGQPQYGQPSYQDAQQPYGQPQYQDAQQPYQDPYGQPMPGQPYGAAPGYPGGAYATPGQGQNNTFGLISMIVGIISIPLVCCWILGVPASIAAIILGIVGRQKASNGEASNGGQALAGLICGGVGLLISVASLVLGIVANTGSLFYTP